MVIAFRRARLVRPSSARAWSQTRGARTELRSASETPWPHCSGEKRATTDRATHARKVTVSRRVNERSDVLAIAQTERTLRYFS